MSVHVASGELLENHNEVLLCIIIFSKHAIPLKSRRRVGRRRMQIWALCVPARTDTDWQFNLLGSMPDIILPVYSKRHFVLIYILL